MTHPHTPPEATPQDGAFLRVFFLALLAGLGLVAAVVLVADPLGRFGTGLVPPAVTLDRDQKARLFLSRSPSPAVLVLGSSRSKTLPPSCFEHATGLPAFNFAVNGAGTEDFLAIARFARAHDGALRRMYVGVDPETLQGTGGGHRALATSRVLAPYLADWGLRAEPAVLGADLFGAQVVGAAFASLFRQLQAPDTLPEVSTAPDGEQRYPRAEAEVRLGRFDASIRVTQSIPGILARYESFPELSPERVAALRQFAREAHDAGIAVTAFIPPVHPAFARQARHTAWEARTTETVLLLRTLEREDLLRFVDTRELAADSGRYVDALHFLRPVAATLAGALTGQPGACALQ